MFRKLLLGILLLTIGSVMMNDAYAYEHEVWQSGGRYYWKTFDVERGSSTDLAVAVEGAMGSGNRDIHIITSGTLYSTINVSAVGVRLHGHGNTFTCNFSGSGILNDGNDGFEVHDLTLRDVVGGYGIRSSAASDLSFTDLSLIDIDWIGMRIDSRNSNPWNYTIYNLYMRDIYVENAGSHAIETYSIDGVTFEGTMTIRTAGGCGVLLNQSRNGTIENVDAYDCNWGGGYAGLRYANACNNITTNYLKADHCGRGFFIVQSGPSVNCHLNNAEIYESSSIGIWIENGTNCSVKAGCSESGVSVSGSGSWADVSSNCSSTCNPTSITPYVQVNGGSWQEATTINVNSGDEVRFGPHPVSGGSWSWSGCGTSGSSREQTIYPTSSCTATATYWNSCGAESNQNFTINVSGGETGSYVQFQNRGTGLRLDGMGRTTNGEACGQYANTTSNNAQWELVDAGSGYYQLQNRGTGLYLDGMGRTTNGDDVGQWANTTHHNSHWSLQQYSGSYYRLQNRGTGLYLDGMGRTTNGSAVGQWANSGSHNAQWQMINVGSGSREVGAVAEVLDEPATILFYPNPVNDVLNIHLENHESAQAQIFDVSGRLIKSAHLTELNNKVDVAELPGGTYFVEVETDSAINRSRLIKQ